MDSSPKQSGPPLLRLGHPLAFAAFLSNVGAPVDRYLRRQKLPVLCDNPDMFVPLDNAWSFFATTAQHEDPMLGWLVGAHVGDHNLNAGLLRKLETAPTLFQALQRLVQLTSAEASHLELGMHERQDDVLFYTHYSGMRDVAGYQTSQAYQIQVILGVIRHFLGRNWVTGRDRYRTRNRPGRRAEVFSRQPNPDTATHGLYRRTASLPAPRCASHHR